MSVTFVLTPQGSFLVRWNQRQTVSLSFKISSTHNISNIVILCVASDRCRTSRSSFDCYVGWAALRLGTARGHRRRELLPWS